MKTTKHYLTLFATLLITTSAFAQDRLGFKFSTIIKTAVNAKGIALTVSGDSLIQITNKPAGRFFTYKFDKLTHVCISENIQIKNDDSKNLKAFVHYIRRAKPQATVIAKGVTVFRSNTEKVVMSEGLNGVEFAVSSSHIADNS